MMPDAAVSTHIGTTRATRDGHSVDSTALFSESTARRIIIATFLATAFFQLLFIAYVGNHLAPPSIGDPYSEADVLRASQGFNEHGITWNKGLSNFLYGDRFKGDGWFKDMDRFPLKDGVYTRYPPLPEWICAGLERLIGFDHLWAFRLFPLTMGLLALAFLIRSLWRAVGPDRAALVGAATALLPMTQSHMSGLHYEGYAQALLFVQLGVLVQQFWGRKSPDAVAAGALGVLGFIQGYLSFDYAFVVAFAGVPLWLLSRATQKTTPSSSPNVRSLVVCVVAAGAGFTLAHVVHFAQVTAFYGSATQAADDLLGRAIYRAVGTEPHTTVVGFLGRAAKALAKMYFAGWELRHFGPSRDLLMLVCALVLWTGPGRFYASPDGPPVLRYFNLNAALPAVLTSLVICCIWYVVMPDMTIIHLHLVPRLQFLWVFTMCLTIALSLDGGRNERQA